MLLVYNKLTISPVLIPKVQEATTEVARNTCILEQFMGCGQNSVTLLDMKPRWVFLLDTPAEYIILRCNKEQQIKNKEQHF